MDRTGEPAFVSIPAPAFVVTVSAAHTASPNHEEAPVGRIVSNLFISLDGVVQAPNDWHFPYWSDEMGEVVGAGFETTEAMLMGRVLYDEWAAYWPTSTDEPIASMFNDMPKYVVSNTLEQADWNTTTILSGDVATAAAR